MDSVEKEHDFSKGKRGAVDKLTPEEVVGRITLPDSGARREFDTGSVRDVRIGKGRFDLLSPFVTKRDAKHMEAGAIKYNDRNWEKGQPLMSYLDSAQRHINDFIADMLIDSDNVEDHLAAIRWNIAAFIHTEEMINRGLLPADLDDRPGPQPKLEDRQYNDPRNQRMPFPIPKEYMKTPDELEEMKKEYRKALDAYNKGVKVDKVCGCSDPECKWGMED